MASLETDLCIPLWMGSLIREELCALFDKSRNELKGECLASASSEHWGDLKANSAEHCSSKQVQLVEKAAGSP